MKFRFVPLLALFFFAACPGDDDAAPVEQVDADTSEPDAGLDAEVPTSCSDGVRNGDEGGVDCGGSCEARCATWAGCRESADCEADHFCIDDNGSDVDDDQTCRPLVASCEGSPCAADELCRQGLHFDGSGDSELYFCEKRYQPGAACFFSDPDVNTCIDGQVCMNGKCVAAARVGDACNPNLSICELGLQCGPAGTCQPTRQVGEACSVGDWCGIGLYCHDLRQVCEPRVAGGAACYGDWECDVGLECQFAAGLTCQDSFDCSGNQNYCCATESGAECRLIEEGPVCEPPAGRCEINTWLDGDL